MARGPPRPGVAERRSPMKKYVLPDLAYEYSALEPHYAARPLEVHHSKHHAAYVAGANTTLEKLATARERRNFDAINQLQKSLAFHVSGHVLHSLFWRNMSPHGGGQPGGEVTAAIQESFGSFDALKSQLTEAALNVQGSGWGALAWEPVGQRLVVEQVYDHQGNIATARCRCSCSICGNMPTTCSINTRRAIGSRPSGRSSIGRMWRSAFRRYAHWTSGYSPVPTDLSTFTPSM